MEFENWYEKIKKNRENFIEYYVSQFGEKNRDIITERFDSLKFCFYIDPTYINMWVRIQLEEEYSIATYNFLKEHGSSLGIDISKISLHYDERYGSIYLSTDDENIEKRLRNIFTGSVIAIGGITDDHRFDDLYAFRNIDDFVNGEGKHYKEPENELLHRRLMFLSDMGEIQISGRPIDYFKTEECQSFANSNRYNELVAKYSELANKAMEYKNAVDRKYNSMIEYMNKSLQAEEQIKKKYDRLKLEEKNPDKIEEYERAYKKEIIALRTVCGNYKLTNKNEEDIAFDCIIDSGDTQTTVNICDEDDEQQSCVFFCPFKSIPGYEDIDLRHEIRHAITTSIKIERNSTKHKIGNNIEEFVDDKCVKSTLVNWNEWITQIEAKKETEDAFSRQIYIISKPNIRNKGKIGQTSHYDNYTSSFKIIYDALPSSAKQSQIELSNDSLYSIIPLTQIEEIEKMILEGYRWDDELENKLHKIAAQITGDTNTYNDTPKAK